MTTATPPIPDLLVTPGPEISAHDRFGFSLFMALVLHGTVIFAVGFTAEAETPAPIHLEVTLAHFEDQDEPDQADYLAQVNQRGSGTETEKSQLTTDTQAELKDLQAREVVASSREQSPRQQQTPEQSVITSESTTEMTLAKPSEQEPIPSQDKTGKQSLMKNALEIASLEAKLDQQRKTYAKRPRVARLTAVSAKASGTAFYMQNWVRKVERVGNLNYPDEARRRGLSGKVRVAVLINDKGGVESIEILKSSGKRILDDAVIRIVRLASPFGAFTSAMKREADQFEIIRTFDFSKRMSSF